MRPPGLPKVKLPKATQPSVKDCREGYAGQFVHNHGPADTQPGPPIQPGMKSR